MPILGEKKKEKGVLQRRNVKYIWEQNTKVVGMWGSKNKVLAV